MIVSNLEDASNFVNLHSVGAVLQTPDAVSLNKELDSLSSADMTSIRKRLEMKREHFTWAGQESKMVAAYYAAKIGLERNNY